MNNYTDDDLSAAVDAGILSEQQHSNFREYVQTSRRDAPPTEPSSSAQESEQFRLVSGFNDIFVVVACGLVIVALAHMFYTFTGIDASLGSALAAWGLAEYFVRKRRMALPGIVLTIVFGVSVFYFLVRHFGFGGTTLALVSGIAAGLVLLYWWRFRVPIAIAGVTACLVFATQILIAGEINGIPVSIPLLQLVQGIAVFAFAMWWDVRDLERQSHRADVAFWLHILAAPLIVSGVFGFIETYQIDVSLWQALSVTVLYILLGLVSLWVDRRALMLAALSVLVYTYSNLLAEYGIVSLNYAITALVVGLGLLALSVYWTKCRGAALKLLPATARTRLP